MANERNFLLGKGEKLAAIAEVAQPYSPTKNPYTLGDRQKVLIPEARQLSQQLDELPESACPEDEAVAVLTLHPAYISKSAFPSALLKAASLRAVGSRQVIVTPKRWTKKGDPKPQPTTELFVAGSRASFHNLPKVVSEAVERLPASRDIIKIESLRAIPPADRVKPIKSTADQPLLEVVLHAGNHPRANTILEGFRQYLHSLEIDVDLERRIDAGELTFVPVRAPRNRVKDIAKFSFLRVAREMPKLRQFQPGAAVASRPVVRCVLPIGKDVVDPTIKVAVFDGGFPDIPALSPWVRRLKGDGVVAPSDPYLEHGLQVTSALLFGPLKNGTMAPVPYAKVDHYRVLDEESDADPQTELYPVLRRISKILETGRHDFVVLCIGPAIPVDDDDVNPWTATLDGIAASGRTLIAVAVGNSGKASAPDKLNRVQPPSDGVTE